MSRVTPGTLVVGIFAILFGLVGAYGVRQYLEQPEAEPVAKRVIQVPLASTNLPAGRQLTLGDIMLMPLTAEKLKQKNLPMEYMSNPQQIIGRTLREGVNKGEAFTTARLYPQGSGPTIAERLRPGYRAVTVVVEGTGLVSGLVGSGTMADVLFRSAPSRQPEIPEKTVTLLENVEVLAVGQNTEPGRKNSGDPKTVTLAVTPGQVHALKVAEGRGSFSLALRTADDDTTLAAQTGPTTLESLLSLSRDEEFTTEIYRAGRVQKTIFAGERIVRQEEFPLPIASKAEPNTRREPAPQSTARGGNLVAKPTSTPIGSRGETDRQP